MKQFRSRLLFLNVKSSMRILIGLSIILSTSSYSQTIHGKITLSGKQASKAKKKDVVVYFEPEIKLVIPALEKPYEVIMKNKEYHPRVSAIPVGSTIRISNKDTILHNAFSPSRSNQFDLGLYGKDKEKDHQLDSSGVVRIFCNVHYHMVAYVLVLETPYHTITDDKGHFKLEGVPEGKGKLFFWHERANRVVRNISNSASQNKELLVDIPITKRRIPIHKNKSGKSYKNKRRKRRY